jgi:uncharacterized protein (DUF2062 family)
MRFNRKHISNVLREALRTGTTPRQLALTFALGFVISIFPIVGTTTWICLGLAIVFRLNIAIIQIVNYLAFPVQLVLILPFINIGSFVFNLNPFPYTQHELIAMLKTNFWGLVSEAGISLGSGVVIWSLVSIPLFLSVFYLTFILFSRWRKPANG